MKIAGIVALVAIALAPFLSTSQAVANMALLAALAVAGGQAWNIAGGFGGMMSFGHVAFFGVGAYTTAILQTRYGVNPWLTLPIAGAIAAAVGFIISWCCSRAGLQGSYFALVTLAIAEAFRILANSLDFTRGGLGISLDLNLAASNFQFSDKRVFYAVALIVALAATLVCWWITRSRFGARLIAIRENPDAARALGVDVSLTRAGALALSGAVTALTGVIYAQVFLYIDPNIAFGVWRSVDMMLVALVGGSGTIVGPIIGGLVLHLLSEGSRELIDIPGFAPALYGIVLLLIIGLLPGGFARLRHA